jgi:hypothetical protein
MVYERNILRIIKKCKPKRSLVHLTKARCCEIGFAFSSKVLSLNIDELLDLVTTFFDPILYLPEYTILLTFVKFMRVFLAKQTLMSLAMVI